MDFRQTIITDFLTHVRLNPEKPAVMDRYGADSYGKLNRRSIRLARKILDACRERGTDVERLRQENRDGARIALLLPRTCDYMTALLAVIRAGCAAVPMDAAYPAERIRTIGQDSGCLFVVTTAELADKAERLDTLTMEEALAEDPAGAVEEELDYSHPEIEGLLVYTSGSTGKPKGVIHRQSIFTHFHIVDRMTDIPMSEDDVCCCMAGFSFIASLVDLTMAIMSGGRVYIADEAERINADLLYHVIRKRKVTGMFMPPKMFSVMRELYGRLPLRYVMVGGEKADNRYAGDGNILEVYAATECFSVLGQPMQQGDGRVLGAPVTDVHTFLVDEDGNRVEEPGKIGELCVVSPWLAIGYNNLPEETAAKFTDCPFEPGQRMYRTGDEMSADGNGRYLFHGRKDRMIKLRGFRVELSEIENAVRRGGNVSDAACIAVRVNGGEKLCCYYTGEETDPERLKQLASASLPEYMVPDYVIRLESLPRNDRNKVDYLALQAMEPPVDEGEYVPPETGTEKAVCDAFCSALGVSGVSVLSDFFGMGGTSLSVAVLIAALAKHYPGLSFQDVMRYPDPRSLAAYLDRAAGEAQDVQDAAEERACYPLTKTQMGIWLEAMTGGNDATYTMAYLAKTDPSVTAEMLIAAVEAVIAAHPSIKYVIRTGEDQIPCMYMVPGAEVPIPVEDGTGEDRLEFMERFMPVIPVMDRLLFYFAVYRTPERCYLAIRTHLIFLDGTAINLLIAEINQALGGKKLLPEEFTVQQAGVREERMMADGTFQSARQYYLDLFRDMDALPALTGDREGSLTPGVSENLRYEPGTLAADRVRDFCEKNQVTESIFFISAMILLLGKYLNSDQVSLSTVYNGRASAQMEKTIGTMIKRIPVYGDLRRDLPVGQFLREVGRQVITNMSNDIYSFDQVLRECPVNEDVEFIYQGSQFTEYSAADGEKKLAEGDRWFIEHYHTGMVTGCMSIQMFSTGGWYNMTVEYRNERFSPAWVQHFAERLFIVAEGMLTHETIGEIPMLTEADRETLARFNDTVVDIPFVPVHRQIHRRAEETPDRVAVTAAGRRLTFRDLDILSNRIAWALKDLGVKPETLVGVLFDREVWAYAAEIAVLKAGGAFVPFIPEYPDRRIACCMEDGAICFLLTVEKQKRQRAELGCRMITLEELLGTEDLNAVRVDGGPCRMPETTVTADHLAYCIYTSGTTGRPKGVMIEHRNIANYVHRNEKSPEIMHYTAPGQVCLALASFSFDVSVVEEFVPLCNGNSVVIATEEEIHNPPKLARLIRENGVTGMTCTPTCLLNLLDIPETREAISRLTFFDVGAEAFPARLYGRLRELRRDSVILNVYGPTEAAMGCAAEEMTGQKTVTVGSPIANTCFFVFDRFGNELPVGIGGELVICGNQVGRGYINLPQETARAFFTHRGMRAYRSGDFAAWTAEGKIRMIGRIDNQIKLRGFRIELDEIEKAIHEYPGVQVSAAAVRKGTGAEFLAGYYVASKPVDPEKLKKYLQEKLPEYMVPSALVELKEMPRTVNEKIDRKALPDPDVSQLKPDYVPPVTPEETAICAAMEKVLQLPEGSVGLEDDFFNLGGNSLSSMRVVTEADIGELTGADIFRYRTPGRIVREIRTRTESTDLDRLDDEARRTSHTLTPLQTELLDVQLFRPDSAMLSVLRFLACFGEKVDGQKLCDAVNQALQNRPAISLRFFFDGNTGEVRQRYDPALTPTVTVRDVLPGTESMLPHVLVRPFNKLTDSSLCRAQMFRGRKGTYLYMDVHHLLLDGASLDIFLQDITDAYFGKKLKRDYYMAYLATEEYKSRDGRVEADEKYFLDRYGHTDWCCLPYSEDAGPEDRGGVFHGELPVTREDVQAAEKRLGVTLSVIQITSILLGISRAAGKKDVMVFWTFGNRTESWTEHAVGVFVNTLPVGCHLDEIPSMRELLASVSEQVLSGIAHNSYNYVVNHFFNEGRPWVESNLQVNMGGAELDDLFPTLIDLENIYTATVGNVMMATLQENEHRDGKFEFELSYSGKGCTEERVRQCYEETVRILEALILENEIDGICSIIRENADSV